ncbi:arginine repressor [Sphingomicrobium sp. XHP0239]|uniref:arginine repressor n=1 Tax=Sphingomicrobium maritimum TaxID=3133972 RepID=UPI0031CC46EF
MTRIEDRRHALARMLRQGDASSQEDLVAALSDAGHPTTQATVSRDLDAIGAVKGRREGRTVYLLPDQLGQLDARSEELDRIVAEWVVQAEATGFMVVVRSRPGSAHIVGAAIDAADLPEVAGTIAGDDTLFIAVRDRHSPTALANMLTKDKTK